jgi:hypothetical protein
MQPAWAHDKSTNLLKLNLTTLTGFFVFDAHVGPKPLVVVAQLSCLVLVREKETRVNDEESLTVERELIYIYIYIGYIYCI